MCGKYGKAISGVKIFRLAGEGLCLSAGVLHIIHMMTVQEEGEEEIAALQNAPYKEPLEDGMTFHLKWEYNISETTLWGIP